MLVVVVLVVGAIVVLVLVVLVVVVVLVGLGATVVLVVVVLVVVVVVVVVVVGSAFVSAFPYTLSSSVVVKTYEPLISSIQNMPKPKLFNAGSNPCGLLNVPS